MLQDVKNYFANFDGTTNICRTTALWITLALVLAFVVTKLTVFVVSKKSARAPQYFENINKRINRASIAVALGTAIAFIILFATLYFVDVANGEDALVPILFYPLLVLLIAVVASAAVMFVKPSKLVKIVCGIVCGGALVAAIVCMIAYYASGEAGEALSNIGLYLSAVLLVAVIIGIAFAADRKSRPLDTRAITFAAICVALSFALSYVRLFKMPMGGSITLASMLPMMLFAFMFGSKKGILAGLVYGVLQAMQDPWIVHPAQFALDYAVAFAAIGLTGCVREFGLLKGKMRAQFACGAALACLLRFIGHYFAGVFAFGMYGADFAAEYSMPALANAYFYSFVYQSMYLVPELAIVIVVGMLVFASASFRRQIEMYTERNKKTVPTEHIAVGGDTAQ